MISLFDFWIRRAEALVALEKPEKLTYKKSWPLQEKYLFLMERDTAVELGGYPQESINLIAPSSRLQELTTLKDGVYCIGDQNAVSEKKKGLLSGGHSRRHVSFGKIVLLETDDVPQEQLYEFMQSVSLLEASFHMKDIMLRQSSVQYRINLRISTKAVKEGFSISELGWTIYETYRALAHVRSVVVILLVGEHSLYRSLEEPAEKIKELTTTLNHIFDGIDMDCGHCDLSAVCNEVEELRVLHRKQTGAEKKKEEEK